MVTTPRPMALLTNLNNGAGSKFTVFPYELLTLRLTGCQAVWYF